MDPNNPALQNFDRLKSVHSRPKDRETSARKNMGSFAGGVDMS